MRARIVRKAMRKQPKDLAIKAFWSAVKRAARQYQYRDGFVEWPLIRAEFDELLGVDE